MGIKSDISNKLVLGFGDYLKHYSSIVAKQHLWKSEIFLHIIWENFVTIKLVKHTLFKKLVFDWKTIVFREQRASHIKGSSWRTRKYIDPLGDSKKECPHISFITLGKWVLKV